MSLRRSSRKNKGKPPTVFTPDESVCKANDPEQDNTPEEILSDKDQRSSQKSSRCTTSTRRRKLEIELQKVREINQIEREFEVKELERRKRLIEAEAAFKTASLKSGSLKSDVSASHFDDLEDGYDSKVKQWLTSQKEEDDELPQQEITTAMQALTKTLHTIAEAKQTINLPKFSGKAEEWPTFLSAYNRILKLKRQYSEEEKMLHLQSSLQGEALELVRPLFVSSKNVDAVIRTLQMRFGRPEFVIESLLNKARRFPVLKEDDPVCLINFATSIQNFTTTAESLEMEAYLTNPQLLNSLTSKLPAIAKYSWAKHVAENKLSVPTLRDFSKWIENEATVMSIYFRPVTDNALHRGPKNFVAVSSEKDTECGFCKGNHGGKICPEFKKSAIDERWHMVVTNKLCFSCFGTHQLKSCTNKKKCGVNDCQKFHNRLLHKANFEKGKTQAEVISVHSWETSQVLLKVCPVILYGPKKEIQTYALIDDGSTTTLIDDKIANDLGLEGVEEPLTTCWTNSTKHSEPKSRRVVLKIQGSYENEKYTLDDVRTMKNLTLPRQDFDLIKLKRKWDHLKKIDQPLPVASCRPTILIGQNFCDLILPRRVIEGPPNSPVLSWSKLGWSLHGNVKEFKTRVDDHFTLMSYSNDDCLHEMVKETLNMDCFGTTAPKGRPTETDRAMNILKETTKKVNDRYESGLLWKTDDVEFPDSYANALARLKTTEKKMNFDEKFKVDYIKKIDEYIDKGYVRKLSVEESKKTSKRTFYLPHFGVTNPNKPGKLRLVFDAAAKCRGMSFNDALLSGPDLLNSLPSVLMKFRQGRFAIVGDIKEMFHQVRIRQEDCDSQRFLWRRGEQHRNPDTYIMQAMTFGATCSPSTALFVVNKNASTFADTFPDACQSILKKEYMDDLLDSVDTEEDGLKRVKEIITIHKEGGFDVVNWMSNSKNIMQQLPHEIRAKSMELLTTEGKLPTERILGLWWNAESDVFGFRQTLDKTRTRWLKEKCFPTKRQILKTTMSVFDPLGLITPFTIKGRILVQKVWRSNIDWDQKILPELNKLWEDYVRELEVMSNIEIPRWYGTNSESLEVELHVFVDASEEAFSAAAYVRISDDKHDPKMSLVFARAKVSPLKKTSIPRLELQAALMGCRVAKTVTEELDLKIVSRTFWSDSTTVLYWICCDSSNFKQFVAHRVAEIQELSEPQEWRWISTKINPADFATRSSVKFTPDKFDYWLRGPKFLRDRPEDWPAQPKLIRVETPEEKKTKFVGLSIDKETQHLVHPERFSSWIKLLRCTAWVLRFIKNLKKTGTKTKRRLTGIHEITELDPEELDVAEKLILSTSQTISFREEKQTLQKEKLVKPTSRIFNLSPFLDADKLIRISGRTRNSTELSEETKTPIIMDGKDSVARLIARHFHIKTFHQGIETVICEIRKRFWFLKVRTTVKKIRFDCNWCKRQLARPKVPEMGLLPLARVSRPIYPFYHTGIDYFGPVGVTVGRRHEKRWGVIFTCLSIRAIHIELAHSLDTESCVMAIQRFASRRPCPIEIYSDNGTNFVGAEKELRDCIKALHHDKIQANLNSLGIKWHFNPPKAPHMGGCWERLVKSVKVALRAVMTSQYPKEEELVTLLARIEFMINSRPLTQTSTDHSDPRPLTPNDFLIESFKYSIEDNPTKKSLRRIRTLCDSFWKRWIKEYLPCLTRRCKWLKPQDPPNVGDVVIMIDDETPRNTWPMGRITATFPGSDGKIRVVEVTTMKGKFRRPLCKVAVLCEGGRM